MIRSPISQNLDAVQAASRPFVEFLMGSRWSRRMGIEGICDFVVGTPHDLPMPEYVEAIRKASIPQNSSWFGYKVNEPNARVVATENLRQRINIPFESEDLFLTNGASSAIIITLNAILNPDDEVIFLSPPWFFYESMIAFVRGKPVRVKVNLETFDLDIEAIADAITAKTRAIFINSPNNPTGKIYPPETLKKLAEVLTNASEKFGQTIYLISDESYNRILFDGNKFSSPTEFYPNSILIYSYAKALLTPGQRLGYLAISPNMFEKEKIRFAIQTAQFNIYGFPDTVHLYALPELEPLCIDLNQLQNRRDLLMNSLRKMGYELHQPEGSWYLLPKTPIPNDLEFTEKLAEKDVFVLPGSVIELSGYIRISLTANDEMVSKSLSVFESVMNTIKSMEIKSIGATYNV